MIEWTEIILRISGVVGLLYIAKTYKEYLERDFIMLFVVIIGIIGCSGGC